MLVTDIEGGCVGDKFEILASNLAVLVASNSPVTYKCIKEKVL